jgi:ATP adenylyltransferase
MSNKCPFCIDIEITDEHGSVFAMKDNYPVTKGHHLIIPYRHTENYFSMTKIERDDSTELIRVLKNKLEQKDPTITGFNIGMNSGESAGQTVMHSHIHLIPRRDGDTKKPRGGVRGVIPDKMSY